jgi:hypothetical protein
LIAIFFQPLRSLSLRSELGNQCRSVCSARGGDLVKRKKRVEGYRVEIVLHFTNSHGFVLALVLSIAVRFEGLVGRFRAASMAALKPRQPPKQQAWTKFSLAIARLSKS